MKVKPTAKALVPPAWSLNLDLPSPQMHQSSHGKRTNQARQRFYCAARFDFFQLWESQANILVSLCLLGIALCSGPRIYRYRYAFALLGCSSRQHKCTMHSQVQRTLVHTYIPFEAVNMCMLSMIMYRCLQAQSIGVAKNRLL